MILTLEESVEILAESEGHEKEVADSVYFKS